MAGFASAFVLLGVITLVRLTLADGSSSSDEQETGDEGIGVHLLEYWRAFKNVSVIEPCEEWVKDIPSRGELTRDEAISKAKNEMCNKNAFSGALVGASPIPGADVLAGVLASFYLQARAACIVAKVRGYDVRDDKTQTMIVVALLGETGSEIARQAGQKLARTGGTAVGKKAFQNLPRQAFRDINKQMWPLLGRHLITKGPQGILSLGKFEPFVGSLVSIVAGAGFDWYFCHWTIDYADRHVFGMKYKGQDELREFLRQEDLAEAIAPLVENAKFDINSICDADQRVLQTLISRESTLKLTKALHQSSAGPCHEGGPTEEDILRDYLSTNNFVEEIATIVDKAKFDKFSICFADRATLSELGLPKDRVLKLHQMLRERGGLCDPHGSDEL